MSTSIHPPVTGADGPGGSGPLPFLQGPGFALFILFLLLLSAVGTGTLLLVPAAESGLGAFARDFRMLCFAGDPQGDGMPAGALLAGLLSPLLLAGFVALAWSRPLASLRGRGPRPFALPASLALAVVFTVAAGLVLANPPQAASLAFPAKGLRTSFAAPDFSLTNQLGEGLSLSDLKGRVVVLTSVYAHCPAACPMIFAQAKRAVGALSAKEREAFTFVAVTMDPERDTPEVLRELAQAQDLSPDTWQLLTGEPDEVEDLLDRMGLMRQRDPETGLIDHANLYLVLDRRGTVAYTFALGELQERWLVEALRLLLAEPPPAA